MRFYTLTHLSAASWTTSRDILLQSYRDYSQRGTIRSKAALAFAATVNAVKTIAFTILSALGALLVLVTFGYCRNKPLPYVCLYASMTKAAFYALFKFKATMDELRVTEAKAICNEWNDRFHGLRPSFTLVAQLLSEAELNKALFDKLQALDLEGLGRTVHILSSRGTITRKASLDPLYRLQAQAKEPQRRHWFYREIASLQRDLYTTEKLLTCYNKSDVKSPLLFNAQIKKVLTLANPALVPQIEAIEKKGGGEALGLSLYDFQLCKALTLEEENRGSDIHFAKPLLDRLEKLARLAKDQNLPDVKEDVRRAASAIQISSGLPDSKEDLAALHRIAHVVESQRLLFVCLLEEVHRMDPTTPQAAVTAAIGEAEKELSPKLFNEFAHHANAEKAVLSCSDRATKSKLSQAQSRHIVNLPPQGKAPEAASSSASTGIVTESFIKQIEAALEANRSCYNCTDFSQLRAYVQQAFENYGSEEKAKVKQALDIIQKRREAATPLPPDLASMPENARPSRFVLAPGG